MMRRGPASVSTRKSRSERFIEDRPDRFRPPPCMPDNDPAVCSVGRTIGCCHLILPRSFRPMSPWFAQPAPTDAVRLSTAANAARENGLCREGSVGLVEQPFLILSLFQYIAMLLYRIIPLLYFPSRKDRT